MKIFEVRKTDKGNRIILLLGMGIKNNSIRRFVVLLTTPPMFIFNVMQVLIFGPPYFILLILHSLALSNAGLWEMSIKRWNEPREADEKD